MSIDFCGALFLWLYMHVQVSVLQLNHHNYYSVEVLLFIMQTRFFNDLAHNTQCVIIKQKSNTGTRHQLL